jgi:hypothetical protein
MSVTVKPYELVWLRELERRTEAGLPVDHLAMMVSLRDELPKGFKPSSVDQRLVFNQRVSLEGLQAIGDRTGIIPDVNRAILYIRGRLIADPYLTQVAADEIARGIEVSIPRAEMLLMLLSSLGSLMASASGTANGYSSIWFGREDVVSEYLAFDSVEAALERRARSRPVAALTPLSVSSEASANARTTRDTAFIVMSMDPRDHMLADVHRTIQEECQELGIRASRIDDIEHSDRITDQILQQIATSEFIIADLTGERPNVYYEIGYAHALGKRPVLIRRAETPVHFDLSVHKASEYHNIGALRDLLRKRLEGMLRERSA